ncbi:MAG: hypothetical protein MK008_09665 [Bdellovibrionales bacterium]|nr:hypothetical protein [Bdellovibrionales bacterium]
MGNLYTLLFVFLLQMPLQAIELSGENNPKFNHVIQQKLNVPFFFTIPKQLQSTWHPNYVGDDKNNSKNLIFDFYHPMSGDRIEQQIGLRLFIANEAEGRKQIAQELSKTGTVQTGDVLLSFRPEWNGLGSYPHIQLGVSHAGLAWIKDGVVRNLDMPLNDNYNRDQLNPNEPSFLSSKHYRDAKFIHIIRPIISEKEMLEYNQKAVGPGRSTCGLTRKDQNLYRCQRRKINRWAERIYDKMDEIYKVGASSLTPGKMSFNSNYLQPSVATMSQAELIRDTGRLATKQRSQVSGLTSFCSEFVWSLLSLRNCYTSDLRSEKPECVNPIFEPMQAVGVNDEYGFTDGPPILMDRLVKAGHNPARLLPKVFHSTVDSNELSSGHKKAAKEVKPLMDALKQMYGARYQLMNPQLSTEEKTKIYSQLQAASKQLNSQVVPTFSPTAFLVQALLPEGHPQKAFKYIATLVYLDGASYKQLQKQIQSLNNE